MISRWLGSWAGIAAVWVVCGVWAVALGPFVGWTTALNSLTFALSIVSLTFTQLVLREQAADQRQQKNMLKEVVRAVPGADDNVCEDTPPA